MQDLLSIANVGGNVLETFGDPQEKTNKKNAVAAGVKNKPRIMQQSSLEEEESSLTIVDMPISERLFDSDRDSQERRNDSSPNKKRHAPQLQSAASNNYVFELKEKQRDNPLLLRKGRTKKMIDEPEDLGNRSQPR
jgi:hypothetical protein